MTAKDMREKRAKLVADVRAIFDKAERENRRDALTGDELTEVRRINDEIDGLKRQIDTVEARESLEREERTQVPESQRTAPPAPELRGEDAEVTADQYSAAFGQFLRRGSVGMTSESRGLVSGYSQRNQNTISGPAGGYLVRPDTSLYLQIVEALKFFGGARNMGPTVLTTGTGADLPMPVDNDTANEGEIVAEEGDHTGGTALSLGQRTLKAYLYSSKIVKVSIQLLQDTEFPIEQYLARKFGMRLARVQNKHFTNGDGANKPQGYITASTVGKTAAAVAAVTFDEILDLVHSVDVAYRANARFSFHDNTALALRKLKDGNNQYLWQPGLQAGQADRLLGYPIVINNDIPTMAASARSIAFGDHSAYYIRDVRAMRVQRLDEKYAEYGQVGFLAFSRHDGGLIDAGTGPIKVLAQAAA